MNKVKTTRYWLWGASLALLVGVSGIVRMSLVNDPGTTSPLSGDRIADNIETQAGGPESYWVSGRATRQPGHAQSTAHDGNGTVTANMTSKNAARAHMSTALDRRTRAESGRLREDHLSMPEWDKIILPGGMLRDDVNDKGMSGSNGLPDFVDLYNGIEAEFIQENISNGVATDMTALLSGPNLADEVLYNGAVRIEHDLGNAYVLATIGTDEHLRIYAGVERVITDQGTFIEFEFNQDRVYLSSGSPWPLNGKRKQGDVLVRMVFSDRMLQSVQLEQWAQDGFRFIETGAGISGNTCMTKQKLMYCVGPPPIQHPVEGFEVWDEDHNALDPVLADDFVEVGIDVDLLAGPQTHFTSVLFRTPEDIAMNNFQVFEHVAQLQNPIGSKTHARQ